MQRSFGDPVKRNLRKFAVLTVKRLSPQIGENTGVKQNCFTKKCRLFVVFPECRFSIPVPEFHRSVALLALYRRGFRKVICYSETFDVFFSAPQADAATGAAQTQSHSAVDLYFISDIQLWTLL